MSVKVVTAALGAVDAILENLIQSKSSIEVELVCWLIVVPLQALFIIVCVYCVFNSDDQEYAR